MWTHEINSNVKKFEPLGRNDQNFTKMLYSWVQHFGKISVV